MLLSLLLATIAPLPVQETAPSPTLSRWKVVGSDERGEYSVDPQTLKRSGDRVRAFVRLRLKTEDGELLGVIEYNYDCKANTSRVLQTTLFESDGSLRAEVPVEPNQQSDTPIETKSPNEEVAAFVCK